LAVEIGSEKIGAAAWREIMAVRHPARFAPGTGNGGDCIAVRISRTATISPNSISPNSIK
jgi:hypothetical protein